GERDGGRRPLAGQRDDGAGAEAELRERLLAQPRDALADVGVLGAGHLEADGVGARGSVVGFRLVGHGEGRGPEGPAGTHGAVRGSRGSVVRGPWCVVSGQWSVVSGQWSVVRGPWGDGGGEKFPCPLSSALCLLPPAPCPRKRLAPGRSGVVLSRPINRSRREVEDPARGSPPPRPPARPPRPRRRRLAGVAARGRSAVGPPHPLAARRLRRRRGARVVGAPAGLPQRRLPEPGARGGLRAAAGAPG